MVRICVPKRSPLASLPVRENPRLTCQKLVEYALVEGVPGRWSVNSPVTFRINCPKPAWPARMVELVAWMELPVKATLPSAASRLVRPRTPAPK